MPSGYFSAAVHAVAADVTLIDFRPDITDAELAHVLRSFKVMANKRPEYLTLLT